LLGSRTGVQVGTALSYAAHVWAAMFAGGTHKHVHVLL
jgi:hypothetical protein